MEFLPWAALGVNIATVVFFGGAAMQRIKALEGRMDGKALKDDRRDAVLGQIRTDVALIKHSIDKRHSWLF